MRTKRMSPLGTLLAGIVAGAAGALAQDLFFAATSRVAPSSPEGAFDPPEPEQKGESATQTVARRVVEDLVHRGPLLDKERAGKVVHYAFGSAWGAVYGLLAGSSRAVASPIGALVFGLGVWAASDDVVLPAFRLAAWPGAYPAKTHAYAVAAHLVYGAAVGGALEAQRRRAWAPLATLAGAAWATRRAPRFARPAARRLVAAIRRSGSATTELAASLV